MTYQSVNQLISKAEYIYIQSIQLKNMIQCSPQQALASVMNNCYSFGVSNIQRNGLKKVFRIQETPFSPRKALKKSLKRCVSANNFPQLSEQIQKNQIDTPFNNITNPLIKNEPNRNSQSYRFIENRKSEANLYYYKQISPKIILQKINFVTSVTQQFPHMPQINKDKIKFSTMETFCSMTDTQKQNSSYIPYENQKISKKKKENEKYYTLLREQYKADEKQIQGKVRRLNSLNPKLTQSLVNSSNIFQDQYSEVVDSSFHFSQFQKKQT